MLRDLSRFCQTKPSLPRQKGKRFRQVFGNYLRIQDRISVKTIGIQPKATVDTHAAMAIQNNAKCHQVFALSEHPLYK